MPKQLQILTNPNPILRKISDNIGAEEISRQNFQELLADMKETMIKKDGAGLAAPQIGRNVRLVVIHHNNKIYFLINPKITKKSWAREIEEEGCLSVLNKKGEIIYGRVERHKKVNCAYLDGKGKAKKISADKIMSRIIQHELDHLDGILFIDKLVKDKFTKDKPVK
ncbi:MAG: peptide deformylase [Candidatus Falkowbacteria bacterium]|nr:peptide deformylase [Candidatus Falkowbacteria bacterium]